MHERSLLIDMTNLDLAPILPSGRKQQCKCSAHAPSSLVNCKGWVCLCNVGGECWHLHQSFNLCLSNTFVLTLLLENSFKSLPVTGGHKKKAHGLSYLWCNANDPTRSYIVCYIVQGADDVLVVGVSLLSHSDCAVNLLILNQHPFNKLLAISSTKRIVVLSIQYCVPEELAHYSKT